MAAADSHLNTSNILELNDSAANSALAVYPFFILHYYEPAGCNLCQRMDVTLSELSFELSGQAVIGKINSKENRRTAETCNITSYPTLLIFKNGTLVETDVGYGSKSIIVDNLRRLKPDMNTSRVTSAKSLMTNAPVEVQKNCSDITKQDQPLMESFVVSYCPFGLQMQRVLAGIVGQIPDISSNIKIRYIVKMVDGNVTSMHGQEESDENLRQICVREEQPDNYWDYISCFLESGNASQSLKTAEVDEVKLDGCLADEQRGLRYALEDLNLIQQFNITGSPTLVMNEEIVNEYDFGGRTEQAVKDLLCCGFSSKPDSCYINLSTAAAKTGFASKISARPSDQSKFSTAQIRIPLAKLGVNNPILPIPVTDETLANALEKYPFFVLMGFADWCGYCQMMNSTILELSKELKGRVAFGLIDAEKNNETAQKYNLVSYPRLLIFRNSTLISTQTGYRNTSQFTKILEGLEPNLNRSLANALMPSVAPLMPGNIIELGG